MKIRMAFPGNYLKAADLQGKRVEVVIEQVDMEDIGGEEKPVVHFRGKEHGLVLNKTNANAIWELTGSDETNDWEDVSIVLFPSKTDFQGKQVDCIRIDPPNKKPSGKIGHATKSKPEPQPQPSEDDDSEVPF